MKSEIDSLSSPQGKTITFRNLDESGSQSFIITRNYNAENTYTQSTGEISIQEDPEQYIHFHLSSNHVNYIPGEIDTESPIKFSDIEDGTIITAQPGYLFTTEERQLVDMSEYVRNNPSAINDNATAFSDTAIEYFKTVKPTSLQDAFNHHVNDPSGLYFLDTSECTNFDNAFSINSTNYTTNFILNLSMLDVSKGETFNDCFFNTGNINNESISVIDISNWKFKENADIESLFDRTNVSNLIMNNVDVSKITSFYCVFNNIGDNHVLEILDLKDWHNNIVENMRMFVYYGNVKIINMPNIDTSKCKYFDNAFYNMENLQEIRGTIDMKSATSYDDMFSNSVSNLTSPIKIKNPPSDTNWWQTAGFTSEGQFEIVT